VSCVIWLPAWVVLLRRSSNPGSIALVDKTWRIFMFWVFLVYPLSTFVTALGFLCQNIDGKMLMQANMQLDCPLRARGSPIFLWSLFGSICYSLGIPTLTLLTLIRFNLPKLARKKHDAAILEALLSAMYRTSKDNEGSDAQGQEAGGPELANTSSHGITTVASPHGSDTQMANLTLQEELSHEPTLTSLLVFLHKVEQSQEKDDVEGEKQEVVQHVQGLSKTEKMERVLLAGRKMVARGELAVVRPKWGDRTATFEELRVLARLGLLFSDYKVEFWYFEIIEMVRKLILTAGILFLYPGSPQQTAAGLLVTVWSLQLFSLLKPFDSRDGNRAQIFSLFTLSTILFYGLLSTITRDSIKTSIEDSIVTVFIFVLHIGIFALPVLSVITFTYHNFRVQSPGRKRSVSTSLTPPGQGAKRGSSLSNVSASVGFTRTKPTAANPAINDNDSLVISDGTAAWIHAPRAVWRDQRDHAEAENPYDQQCSTSYRGTAEITEDELVSVPINTELQLEVTHAGVVDRADGVNQMSGVNQIGGDELEPEGHRPDVAISLDGSSQDPAGSVATGPG